MADLNPCPFCEAVPGPALFARNNASESVVCNKCGARGPMGGAEEEAVAMWNQQPVAAVPSPTPSTQPTGAQGEADSDAAMLDWLLPRISGKAYREAGVIYSGGVGSIREAIRTAMKEAP